MEVQELECSASRVKAPIICAHIGTWYLAQKSTLPSLKNQGNTLFSPFNHGHLNQGAF